MIKLRTYKQSDIHRLVELADDERVSRYLIDTFPHPYTEADAEWWVNTGASLNGALTFVVEWNGEFVGSCGLTPLTGWKAHCAEVGYWMGSDYWGHGLATQSLQLITESGFVDYGFRKLFAPVLAPNLASMRVLEKCGYQKEGIHQQEVFRNDQYYDLHWYAKLSPALSVS